MKKLLVIIAVFSLLTLTGCSGIKEQNPNISWMSEVEVENFLSGNKFQTENTISTFYKDGSIKMCMKKSSNCYHGSWEVNKEGKLWGHFPEFSFDGYFSIKGDYYPTNGKKQSWIVVQQVQ